MRSKDSRRLSLIQTLKQIRFSDPTPGLLLTKQVHRFLHELRKNLRELKALIKTYRDLAFLDNASPKGVPETEETVEFFLQKIDDHLKENEQAIQRTDYVLISELIKGALTVFELFRSETKECGCLPITQKSLDDLILDLISVLDHLEEVVILTSQVYRSKMSATRQ